jgi:hypothetical protein
MNDLAKAEVVKIRPGPANRPSQNYSSAEVTVGFAMRSMSGFTRQRRQNSSAKGNALVTRPRRCPAPKGQNSGVCCPFRARNIGWPSPQADGLG